MSTTRKADIVLILCGLFLGIYVYAKGFWLSRTELKSTSNCSFIYNGSCPSVKYKRVVIVIVDALKYDFIDNQHKSDNTSYWKGNMKMINDIMKKNSPIRVNGILSHLIADPPTVTLTRLKGITAGSLPTFTDVSFNFGGGSHIGEDNLIDQWNRMDIPIIFNGDDTWLELFPREKFHSVNPFSSFVVKDLDMVDQGVTKALDRQFIEAFELNTKSHFILINHLLGVDHCGHTYGQNHPEMKRKLSEMNTLLKRIISKVDDSTLVLFMGDHGMTMQGDHGGDSDAETDAGLFLYSKAGFPTEMFDKVLTMSQTDLVPLLSFLTGVPIPFSNLGILESRLVDTKFRAEAMIANARQVLNFALSYKIDGNDTGSRLSYVIDQLRSTLHTHTGHTNHTRLISKLQSLLMEMREIYRAKWTQFQPIRIYQGILLVASAFLHLIRLQSLGRLALIFQSVNFSIAIASLYVEDSSFAVMSISLSASYCAFNIYQLINKITHTFQIGNSKTIRNPHNASTLMTMSLWLLYCCTSLSNSFINNEDSVLLFLIQTVVISQLILLLIRQLYRSNLRKLLQGRVATHLNRRRGHLFIFTICATAALVCVLPTMLFNWRTCREEQSWCDANRIIRPIASISDEFRTYKSWRYFSSVLTILAMLFLHYKWFKYLGNINGFGLSALVMRYGLSSASVLLCCHWTLQCLPSTFLKIVHPWHLTIFPRLTLTSCIITLFSLLLSPLIIFMPSNDDVYVSSNSSFHWSRMVPQIFNRIKQLHSSRDEIVKVYGLYSVYSAWQFTTLLALSLVMILFLGDGFAAPIFLLICMIVLLLCFQYLNNLGCSNQFDYASSWSIIALWAFLSQYSFYITGHQATLSSLQWHSAYIIWHGEHSTNFIPFLSILINTFAGPIIISWSLSLLLPLLCRGPSNPVSGFVPREITCGSNPTENGSHCGIQSDSQDSVQSGEFSLADSDLAAAQYSISLKLIYLKFIALHVLQAVIAMYSAGFHRRHLMVWKIFAPRMIFSLICLTTVVISSFLSYLASTRLHSYVIKWKKSYLDRK